MIGNNSFLFIYVLIITILVPSIMFLSFLFFNIVRLTSCILVQKKSTNLGIRKASVDLFEVSQSNSAFLGCQPKALI